MKRLFYFLTILLIASSAWASPFLVSDPSPSAEGGQFIVWETKTVKRTTATRLYFQGSNLPDGAVWMDLVNVPKGDHKWAVQYLVDGEYSGSTPCVLTVTQSCVTVKRKKTCTKTFNLAS